MKELYNLMLKIRKVEERIIDLYPSQEICCPVHLYIGQEAIATGVCKNLKKNDIIFTNHRSHGHYLAKGGNLKSFFAELYGKKTGCSKGYGGSMHMIDRENGIWGGSAIVGGAIPIATGVALSLKLKKENNVVVSFFGDGAVEEGVFHESLNFASLWNLPIIFVCENNLYATQTHLSNRESNQNIYQKAVAYNMPGVRVDGTNVLEIFGIMKLAYERALKGQGPTLIEAVAYRWKGHVGPNEDYEMGHRTKEELDKWKNKCPIKKYKDYLIKYNILQDTDIETINKNIDEEINQAVKFAKESKPATLCEK